MNNDPWRQASKAAQARLDAAKRNSRTGNVERDADHGEAWALADAMNDLRHHGYAPDAANLDQASVRAIWRLREADLQESLADAAVAYMNVSGADCDDLLETVNTLLQADEDTRVYTDHYEYEYDDDDEL